MSLNKERQRELLNALHRRYVGDSMSEKTIKGNSSTNKPNDGERRKTKRL